MTADVRNLHHTQPPVHGPASGAALPPASGPGSRPPHPPARHGADLAASRQQAARLRMLIPGDPAPGHRDWAMLGQALWRGDPLADDLVEWMHREGMGRAWRLVEQGLAEGPQAGQRRSPADPALPAPSALEAFLAETLRMPAWIDQARLDLGARVLQTSGLHAMRVLRDAGLMAGYQASAINQTLLMTGALHKGAQRRVAETTAWWLACTAEGGMTPGAPGHAATLKVRIMHALVRRHVAGLPGWNAERLGLPVNQVDMQATYLAFSVVQLLSLRVTGVWITRRESDAVMHLWRYIGWLMGVEEGLLCDDEHHGRVLLYRNVLSQAPADDSSVQLGRALMDEPLHRHYPRAARWCGRFNRARHLSLVRWFVGPDGMARLGLPPTLPWYPVLTLLPRAAGSVMLHALPPLRERWRRHARQQQLDYLQVLMGPGHERGFEVRAGHRQGQVAPGAPDQQRSG